MSGHVRSEAVGVFKSDTYLDVLLQILGPLERLAAKVTLVRLQGHMDADVGCDVISLDGSGSARIPLARQVEVVGALPANMAFTDVILSVLARLGWLG